MSSQSFAAFLTLLDEASFLMAAFQRSCAGLAAFGANKIVERLGREWICDV